jgi:hypothetical protein
MNAQKPTMVIIAVVSKDQREKVYSKLAGLASADLKCCYTSCSRCAPSKCSK